jgi:hypothetical protein
LRADRTWIKCGRPANPTFFRLEECGQLLS